jgi:hypothetical protein
VVGSHIIVPPARAGGQPGYQEAVPDLSIARQ